VTVRPEFLIEAKLKYEAYSPEDWTKIYFDEKTGGYIVINNGRIEHSKSSKNEKAKFDKEYEMSMVFAQNGYRIEMLKETPRIPSPDVRINGVTGDLKRVSSHNNIVKDAKKAIRKQGAEIVLFEFEKETQEIYSELLQLKKDGIPVYYYFSNEKNKIHEL
jgi:hypothetical protein